VIATSGIDKTDIALVCWMAVAVSDARRGALA